MAPHWYDYVSHWYELEDEDEWDDDLDMDDECGRGTTEPYYWEYYIPWQNINTYDKYYMYMIFGKIDALRLYETGILISYDRKRRVFIASYYRRGQRSADFIHETNREELETAEFNSDKLILKKILAAYYPDYSILLATSDTVATLNEILLNNKEMLRLKKLQKKKNI